MQHLIDILAGELVAVLARPPGDDSLDIYVLVIQEDHSHAGYGGWRCVLEVVRFEDEVHIGTKTNSLAGRQCQQVVVVQY